MHLTLAIRDVLPATSRARIVRLALGDQPFDFAPGGGAADQSWRQACTACFENDGSEPLPVATKGTSAAVPSGPTAGSEPVAEPAAALAGMAFVLGGYWGRQVEEQDSERKRRANRI